MGQCWTLNIPCITIKFTTLVYAEDEVHLLARPIGLVQNAFVVALSRPQTLLHTQVQVELARPGSVKTTNRRKVSDRNTCVSDLRMKYRLGKYAVRMLEFVDA